MRKAITQLLPVDLTDNEVIERAQECAAEVANHAELETQKKNHAKELGDKIKDSDEKISRLSCVVRARSENRQVACTATADLLRRTLVITRDDTGKVVESRPLTAAEYEEAAQGVLFADDDMVMETTSRKAPLRKSRHATPDEGKGE